MMATQIIFIAYVSSFAATRRVMGFSTNGFVRSHHLLTVHFSSYGRGAEIWPECNENQIQLSDSFPGGIIPSEVAESQAFNRVESSEIATVEKKSRLPQPIQRILTRVPKVKVPQNDDVSFDKTPTVISIALLLSGLVRPLDVAIAAGISGYLAVLYYWARSPRSDGFSPHVPSLPPQGHVPDLVINPLGISFANSNGYNAWLKTGAVLSLFAPIAVLLECTIFSSHGAQIKAARSCARPLFLLCCQSMVELKFRQIMAPLPLRILVPVAFNTARLIPLWRWASISPLSLPGRLLAVANLLYWSANLFAFLIPTAAMRYMRAYFLCVEAEQVTTRPGFENSVGLLS